jgi:hypothetical protein
MRKALTALVVTTVIAGGGAPVRANVVANGGFEADDSTFTTANTSVLPYPPNYLGPYPSGWTDSGNVGVVNTFSNSGTASAFLGNGGSLSQVLTTLQTDTYNITFYVGVDDSDLGTDSNAIFDATFGGTDLLAGQSIFVTNGVTGQDVGPAVNNAGFEEFTITGVAPSAGTSTALTFTSITTGSDGPWYLDDVDVEAVPSSVSAPEPSALLLLLPALAGMALIRRRAA